MWNDSLVRELLLSLDAQERLVLESMISGTRDVEEIRHIVKKRIPDADDRFVEAVYNVASGKKFVMEIDDVRVQY